MPQYYSIGSTTTLGNTPEILQKNYGEYSTELTIGRITSFLTTSTPPPNSSVQGDNENITVESNASSDTKKQTKQCLEAKRCGTRNKYS